MILKLEEDFEHSETFLAQCIEGAIASSLSSLQAQSKRRCPCSLFIHCDMHMLNLVLTYGVGKICLQLSSPTCRLAKSSFPVYICHNHLPRVAPTRWNIIPSWGVEWLRRRNNWSFSSTELTIMMSTISQEGGEGRDGEPPRPSIKSITTSTTIF